MERIAGNDIKSENQLQLAHLLAVEGNAREAKSICSYWKGRMRRLASGQDSAHLYGIPKTPLRDTPEAEMASWDLSCGNPGEGLKLIEEQISASADAFPTRSLARITTFKAIFIVLKR